MFASLCSQYNVTLFLQRVVQLGAHESISVQANYQHKVRLYLKAHIYVIIYRRVNDF